MSPALQCVELGGILTVILSSWSVTWMLFLFQEMVGSGWPLGGIHSITAGSPAATTTSLGVWRKSSLRTAKVQQQDVQYEVHRTKDGCTFTSARQRSITIEHNLHVHPIKLFIHAGLWLCTLIWPLRRRQNLNTKQVAYFKYNYLKRAGGGGIVHHE